jgi:hypothetical protein
MLFLACLIFAAIGAYLAFIQSPELTHSQLLIEYWWFYLPGIIVLGVVFSLTSPQRKRR